jgi:hypothetical protein
MQIQPLARMDTGTLLSPFTCIILMMVCLCAPLQASPAQSASIRQGLSLSSNILYENEPTSVTLVTTSIDSVQLSAGLRMLESLKDVTVQAHYALPSLISWTQGVASTTAHAGWGMAESMLLDWVFAYEQHFKGGSVASASISLGLQAHASLIPSLDEPLYNVLPYFQAKLSITPIEKLVVESSLGTTSFFDYSGQCWTPVVDIDVAYQINKAFAVGFNAFVRFSDIHPETVLILSQEVGVYVTMQN